MSIRLFFSDVDGTIVSDHNPVSERTRAAIRACEEKGVPFVIVSGRWFSTAKKAAVAAGQREGYIIAANGGDISRLDGTPVKGWHIPEDDARRIYEIMLKYPVAIHVYHHRALYRLNVRYIDPSRDAWLAAYLQPDEHSRLIVEDRAALESEGLRGPFKLEAYSSDFSALDALNAELTAAGYSVTRAVPDDLEIVMPGMGKGAAVRWLAEHLGVSREECMAFGDNTNDLSMLAEVGWPVAVGNAVDEVRNFARIVADSCEDDGVAKIIEKCLEEYK